MHSACVREMDENLKERLIESLEFINWKRHVKKDSTVFIKHNFTFCYYKEWFTALSLVTKEFGTDNGVIYADRSEDALKKAVELIETESVDKEGIKAREFVEKLSWDNLTDEFEGVLENLI